MTDTAAKTLNKLKCEARGVPHLAMVIFNEVMRTRVLTIGAAVAFFFLLSLVPLLAVFSALLSALPVPHLWDQLLGLIAMLVPPAAMVFVRSIIASVITPHPARILSIGILTYLWSAAGAFSALIEALNIAYDVQDARSWWRDRVQALLLTFTCGGLSIVGLLTLLAGPPVVHFVSYAIPIPYVFAIVWPPLRLAILFTTFVMIVMLLYFLGPNRKVPFKSLLPGSAVAVVFWVLGSTILSEYVSHFSDYNAAYGSLGAIIILMLWLYLTSVVLLVGAELNAELWKRACGKPEGVTAVKGGQNPTRIVAQPPASDVA